MVTEVDLAHNKLGLSLKPSYLKSLADEDDVAAADAEHAPDLQQGIDDLALSGLCPALLASACPSHVSVQWVRALPCKISWHLQRICVSQGVLRARPFPCSTGEG